MVIIHEDNLILTWKNITSKKVYFGSDGVIRMEKKRRLSLTPFMTCTSISYSS